MTDERDQETLAQVATIHRYLCDLRHTVASGSNASTVFVPIQRPRQPSNRAPLSDAGQPRPKRPPRVLDFP